MCVCVLTLQTLLTLSLRNNPPFCPTRPRIITFIGMASHQFVPLANLSDVKSCGGSSLLQGYAVRDVVEFMLEPIMVNMEEALERRGRGDLKALLTRYVWFRIGLGMVRPVRVDEVWDATHICYNVYLANLLTRTEYYDISANARGDVQDTLEDCSAQWNRAWRLGKAASGDESIVPHKGRRAGHLRQHVPRKPHNTGLKLYCLADSLHAYTVDVYLYCGKRGMMRRSSSHSGRLSSSGVMYRWADKLPSGTALIADSFFGSRKVAVALAARNIPFLMLTKRSTAGVAELKKTCFEGHVKSAVEPEGFAVAVFKHPAVGSKPPRAVPFLHNIAFSGAWHTHRAGYRTPLVVYAYRKLAGGVDTSNQMALQHRELGRCSTWAQAVRHFLIRYAITNAFTTCGVLGLIPSKERMSIFQWQVLKTIIGVRPQKPIGGGQEVHVPRSIAARKVCAHCKQGTSTYECTGCRGVSLHVKCFAAYHGVQ